jgi:RNA polymerase sigma factor (sigma-70 family)
MAARTYGAVLQQIDRLFRQGSGAGLPEWQLLNRYVTRRDESAFEAIVARHGPMVLGVCRRVLDDPHAVEDAFQATFLVLVRKAGSLSERDAIGHWLYGVAHRVALRARADAARRRIREKLANPCTVPAPLEDPSRCEIGPLLDDELSRLPGKYRAPIVLCYLEGLTASL